MNWLVADRGLTVSNPRALALATALVLPLIVGCGDAGAPSPYVRPGTGGSSGAGGDSGSGGAGGELGSGGVGGTGGVAGTGGTGSTVGSGGSGGSGGISTGPCVTNALCHTCPDTFLCNTDDDCAFSGYVCVASGCETHGGAPIKQCQPSRAPSCETVGCPNSTDYVCAPVGAGGKRCLRVSAGCQAATESYDCPPGFSCEGGSCVDRRMPCDTYLDCPKSHVCVTTPTSKYCVRTHRTCEEDTDCGGFLAVGSWCADVDNDGVKECVGDLDGQACVNADCATSGPGPVCESGAASSVATCGDYGLCQDGNDCAGGFACVGLWQDGRKECVPTGGICDHVTDCPLHQVCAAPRSGGSPRCQAGKEAM